MVLNAVFVALFLRGAPRRGWTSRSGWRTIEAALRRDDARLENCVAVLRRAGCSTVAAILEEPGLLAWAENALEEGHVISIFCESYPRQWEARLGELAPLALWVRGPIPDFEVAPIFSVVGSRVPTASNAALCQALAAFELPGSGNAGTDEEAGDRAGFCSVSGGREPGLLVSGGAAGCDSLAREAALAIGRPVVEVLPHGLGISGAASPASQGPANGVTWMSVCGPREMFTRATAMERNLLIYALGDVTFAIQPRWRAGGTWWGVVEALKRGLGPVLVGSIDSALEEMAWSGLDDETKQGHPEEAPRQPMDRQTMVRQAVGPQPMNTQAMSTQPIDEGEAQRAVRALAGLGAYAIPARSFRDGLPDDTAREAPSGVGCASVALLGDIVALVEQALGDYAPFGHGVTAPCDASRSRFTTNCPGHFTGHFNGQPTRQVAGSLGSQYARQFAYRAGGRLQRPLFTDGDAA